jgi:hypothetical protein
MIRIIAGVSGLVTFTLDRGVSGKIKYDIPED